MTVGYDGVPLIRDVEIRLEKGHILTLIGPNGAGKSTILKSISKYLKTVYGTAYISGRPLTDMSNRALARQMAVVLTQKMKTELMTCQEIVETGRYPYTGKLGILSEEDHLKVREAMEQVHVWELRHRDFMRISDGQRQRVMLARAICQEPQIIVLDEPSSFLDIHYKLELLDALRDMARQKGISVIMSLHELDLAQRVSDEVMCVSGDYITHYGHPETIFQKELIHRLYGLTEGGYNPYFGSLEMRRPAGEPQIFVIAGGGTGIETFRALQRSQTPFITGILHENDIDYQVASDLASEIVAERSFCQISDEKYEQAVNALRRCSTVINCLSDYGDINRRNRDLLEAAVSMGCHIGRPGEE
ncbi:MAG: ABC transporter ATP-binding protein [Clostridiales bacterium]|nr:ABC transporter ATP-binding protein [Clostridiales bacterium]